VGVLRGFRCHDFARELLGERRALTSHADGGLQQLQPLGIGSQAAPGVVDGTEQALDLGQRLAGRNQPGGLLHASTLDTASDISSPKPGVNGLVKLES